MEFGEDAEIQIVHTCSVTSAAVRDGRQALRQARKRSPGGTVIATGCAVRTSLQELLPVEDITVMNDPVDALAYSMDQPHETICEHQSRTRALLKIHDGCYFKCSFCIVPQARPVEISKPVEEAIGEARCLVVTGHKEIVLTGVRITGYRPEGYGRAGLMELIKRLGEVNGLLRVRLTSLYPSEVDDNLLRVIADSPNACRHLHLSLQSGDNGVLKRMNRHYTVSQFQKLVDRAREFMPDVALTADIIAGFPGETDEEFANTRELMRRVGFSRAHIFTYSPRPGTSGADMPGQVPSIVAKSRTKELIAVAAETGRLYRTAMLGRNEQIIVEQQEKNGKWTGVTGTYVETEFDGPENLRGRVVEVKITGLTRKGLAARMVNVL